MGSNLSRHAGCSCHPNWSFCAPRTGRCGGCLRPDAERRRAVSRGAERQL